MTVILSLQLFALSYAAPQTANFSPATLSPPEQSIAIEEIAKVAGFICRFDPLKSEMKCTRDNLILRIWPAMFFYTVNDTVYQASVLPAYIADTLYLPVSEGMTMFGRYTGNRLLWSDKAKTISLKPDTSKALKAEAGDTLSKKGAAEIAMLGKETIKTIVIDPGHGGRDPGAIGSGGIKEKDVVLKIGLELRNLLDEKTDCKVYMTRDKDTFIPLRERTEFANRKKADIFISIHANSIPDIKKKRESIHGYKVYFLSQAKNEEDKLTAMTENAVVQLEDKPQDVSFLQGILTEMMNNEYLNESQDLSILIAESFAANLTKVPKLHLGVGQAPFWVLTGAYMPSVLIEMAFISNAQEEQLLATPAFRKKAAAALFDAVVDFRKKYRSEL